jgi:hypothetical protein
MKLTNTNLDNETPGFNGGSNAFYLTVFGSEYHHMNAVWGI